ncbi:MAG TPA: ABC transporter ATP-binding protein [Pirellulales bacterium]|nr:ABC transporter ATP-binding protein [Pirellulales bacterium]
MPVANGMLFETRDVARVYRRGSARELSALAGVSLTIKEGTCCVLTGPSGSGKSTLLALLGAMERPTSGDVLFRGQSLSGLSDVGLARVRRRFGFVFQGFSLLARLPVWENVTYPLVPRGVGRARRLRIAGELLEPLELADRMHDRAGTLSGGEQQRVALARALVVEPEVVLADEPTSQLDRNNAERLAKSFEQLLARGVAVVLSTHDPRLIELATQVLELEAGRLKG